MKYHDQKIKRRLKQFGMWLLVLQILLLSFVIDVGIDQTVEASSPTTVRDMEVGDVINFGGEEWVIQNPSTGYIIRKKPMKGSDIWQRGQYSTYNWRTDDDVRAMVSSVYNNLPRKDKNLVLMGKWMTYNASQTWVNIEYDSYHWIPNAGEMSSVITKLEMSDGSYALSRQSVRTGCGTACSGSGKEGMDSNGRSVHLVNGAGQNGVYMNSYARDYQYWLDGEWNRNTAGDTVRSNPGFPNGWTEDLLVFPSLFIFPGAPVSSGAIGESVPQGVPVFTSNSKQGSVTITMSDPSGVEGITKRQYRIDSGEWVNYTKPFTVTSNVTVFGRIGNGTGFNGFESVLKITGIETGTPKIEVFTDPKEIPNEGSEEGGDSGNVVIRNTKVGDVVRFGGDEWVIQNPSTGYIIRKKPMKGSDIWRRGSSTYNWRTDNDVRTVVSSVYNNLPSAEKNLVLKGKWITYNPSQTWNNIEFDTHYWIPNAGEMSSVITKLDMPNGSYALSRQSVRTGCGTACSGSGKEGMDSNGRSVHLVNGAGQNGVYMNPYARDYQYWLDGEWNRNTAGDTVRSNPGFPNGWTEDLLVFPSLFIFPGAAVSSGAIGESVPQGIPVLTADPKEGYTNNSVTITMSDPEGAGGVTKRQYKIGSGSWMNYTKPFTVSSNVIIIGRIGNDTGFNGDEAVLKVTNIDKTPPAIQLSASPSGPSKDVTITANVTDQESGVAIKKWSQGNQTVSYFKENGHVFTGSTFTVTENGVYTVYARDKAGNEAVQTITISNIERTPPLIKLSASPTELTQEDVTITADITDESGIAVQKWLKGDYSTDYFKNEGTVFTGSTFKVSENSVYTVYAKDKAGNEAVRTIRINNIQEVLPPTPTFRATPTAPTTGLVRVTISFAAKSTNKQYRIIANGNTGEWRDYTLPVAMTENGMVEARAQIAGVWSGVGRLMVSNIVSSSVPESGNGPNPDEDFVLPVQQKPMQDLGNKGDKRTFGVDFVSDLFITTKHTGFITGYPYAEKVNNSLANGDSVPNFSQMISEGTQISKEAYESQTGQAFIDDWLFTESENNLEKLQRYSIPISPSSNLVPGEIYKNGTELRNMGLSDMTFEFNQSFSFQHYLFGSGSDEAWIIEQPDSRISMDELNPNDINTIIIKNEDKESFEGLIFGRPDDKIHRFRVPDRDLVDKLRGNIGDF